LVVLGAGGEVLLQNIHAHLSAPVPQGAFATRVVNEYAAHCLGGRGKKMGAAMPLHIVFTREPQPRFMDQRGGLQRLVELFAGHLVGGELAQFVIDQRQQFIRRFGVAGLDGL
jgi:hypothetical protein